MTAGLLGNPPSEQPTNSPSSVNKFAPDHEAFESLLALAPLHQRYAVERGLKALKLKGDAPPLEDLALAITPPTPPKLDLRPCLEGDRLHAWAVHQFLGDDRYTDENGGFDFQAAVRAANRIIGPIAAAEALKKHNESMAAFRFATAIYGRWHDLAIWLCRFAESMLPWVSGSRLAAMPESKMAELARLTASRHLADIQSARMVGIEPDGTRYLAETGEIIVGALPALTANERRLMCHRHWRRQLRKQAKRARQFWAAALQTVGRHGGTPYADDYAHGRWEERQEAAKTFGELYVLRGADGTTLPLGDVMRSSVAATLNRVYVMTVGLEDIAVTKGLVPIFLTLTLPPEFHPNPRDGECSWQPEFAPEAADGEIARLWGMFRARLAKTKIATLGMRVYEGHEDGCPHLHALLYVPPDDIPKVDVILQKIRPEPIPGKRIATKLVVIDRRKARAATYVMKYILKALNQRPADAIRDENLDPTARRAVADGMLHLRHDDDEDDDGDEPDRQIENFDHHRALASERGWRRFALLGVHGIQRAWQRLYTLDEAPGDAPANVREAHAAMKERRWGDAILALGALRVPGATRVRLDYDESENAYGEVRRVPMRMLDERTGWTLPLRTQAWTIERQRRITADDGAQDDDDEGNDTSDAVSRMERNLSAVTVAVSYPRGAAVPTAETPETSGTMPQMAPPTGTPRPAEPSG